MKSEQPSTLHKVSIPPRKSEAWGVMVAPFSHAPRASVPNRVAAESTTVTIAT